MMRTTKRNIDTTTTIAHMLNVLVIKHTYTHTDHSFRFKNVPNYFFVANLFLSSANEWCVRMTGKIRDVEEGAEKERKMTNYHTH